MKRFLFVAAVSALAITACKKDGGSTPGTVDGGAIQFSSNILTRASGTTWDSGDFIGIYMVEADAGLTNTPLEANKKYTTNGDGAFTAVSGDEIYYPMAGSVDFIAYYPWKSAISENTYPVDVNDQSSPAAIDLLYSDNATGYDKTAVTPVGLTFYHKLSRLIFSVTDESGETLTGTAVKITGMKTRSFFSLTDASFNDDGGSVANITALTSVNGATFTSSAIILPANDLSGAVVTFEVPALDETFDWAIPDGQDYESGKQYTYEFIIEEEDEQSVLVGSNATIEDWITVDNGAPTALVPREVIDLSADATANSYIVNEIGKEYKFNATVKGNSTESVGTPVSAKLLWTDKANIISSVTLKNQSVRFTLEGNGNGVIAVMDDLSNILWSWHIYAPEEAIADEKYVNHYDEVNTRGGATYYVMNRNFGAMKSRSGVDCLLFQWGRKDPFPNVHTAFKDGTGTAATFVTMWPPVEYNATGDGANNNVAYAVAHPATFITSSTTVTPNFQSWMTAPDMNLWGDMGGFAATYENGGWSGNKTIYDPCPAGYRVANVKTFSGFTTTGLDANNVPANYNVVSPDWGEGATGHWFFIRYEGDTEGTYWPNTAGRNATTGVIERGNFADHYCSNTTGGGGTSARALQIYGTRVNPVAGSVTAIGHALRCVRYKSETETNSSDYTPVP